MYNVFKDEIILKHSKLDCLVPFYSISNFVGLFYANVSLAIMISGWILKIVSLLSIQTCEHFMFDFKINV